MASDHDYWLHSNYEEHFGDVDSENPAVLEMCVVGAEEELCENLPEDVNFQTIKDGFKKFYDRFVDAFISKKYWDYHELWVEDTYSY